MKTKIPPHIIPAAIAVALFCAVAFLAHAATITVTNTSDSGAGSLRQALIDASDGDTITFAVSGTIVLTSGQLLVDKDVTIDGPGAASLAVDGNATSRLFRIGSGKTVAISGLTITNGYAYGEYGGGIYNDHSTLTLSNCTIKGNSAVYAEYCCDERCECYYDDGGFGGGVYNYAGTLMLSNCTISGNSAYYNGGGVFNAPDGYGGGSSLVISNSVISGNSAYTGGGIYNLSSSSSALVEITNSTLSGNWSTDHGGGIYNVGYSGDATLTLTNCTISGNSSGFIAGGIYNYAEGNTANATLSNCTISGNSACDGGGISNQAFPGGSGVVEITNSTISGNLASCGGAPSGTMQN